MNSGGPWHGNAPLFGDYPFPVTPFGASEAYAAAFANAASANTVSMPPILSQGVRASSATSNVCVAFHILTSCVSLERVEVDPNAHGPQENLREKHGHLMPMWWPLKAPRPGLVDSRLPHLGGRGVLIFEIRICTEGSFCF